LVNLKEVISLTQYLQSLCMMIPNIYKCLYIIVISLHSDSDYNKDTTY